MSQTTHKGDISDDIIVEDFDNPIPETNKELIYRERQTKHDYWLSGYALGRVMANQNYIVVITGTTGSGKSYSAMTLALDIDPNFNIDRVVFRADDFVRVVKTSLPPGSVILWDEAGVGLSSREWFSIQNKMIAFILETFRRDNLILIMTTPNMNFIDTKVRSLFHGYAETIDPTFTGGRFGWVKYFHIVVNLREGKVMFRYPRIRTKSGMIKVLRGKTALDGNTRFNKPPDWLTEDYEKKKFDFTENLKDKALEALTAAELKKEVFDLRDIIEMMEHNPKKFGLLTAEDTNQTDLVNNTYVLLTLENPTMKISKPMIQSAVRYLVHVHGSEFKDPRRKALSDDDIMSVAQLMSVHGSQASTARALYLSEATVSNAIRDWKKRKVWIDLKKLEEETDGHKNGDNKGHQDTN